ncbi:MAG: 50S ribosomal protein L13 [Dehalococcoidia bacterium]|jgi:large subunit ribosomal protein L13
MKTYAPKLKEIERKWHVIDATGQTLGRMSVQVARLLMGKHKAMFANNIDTGDFVVVINAAKVRVTGKKMREKSYYRYSGYPGGISSMTLGEMLEKHPTRAVEHAVKGMLPNSRLGRAMYKKLKVYAGDEHPHKAQVAGAKESDKGSDVK